MTSSQTPLWADNPDQLLGDCEPVLGSVAEMLAADPRPVSVHSVGACTPVLDVASEIRSQE